jgi:formylmethanofuran dehydrogenase subunit E
MSKSTPKDAQKYPEWICSKCGDKYGNRPVGLATWHREACSLCGEVTPL